MTVAMSENLLFVTGDIGNAFLHGNTQGKIYSITGSEFGEKKDYMVIIKKALYGLSTSARAWNIELGDMIRGLGFVPTRADPDLWIRLDGGTNKYEYIATYVDDLIMVGHKSKELMGRIKEKYPIRNISEVPEYYLGNNLNIRDAKIKVSSKKYITEVLMALEQKHGQSRKEKVPMSLGDHPELDDTPLLSDDMRTQYQSNIGILQWICHSGSLGITYAVSSLSRFNATPHEGHFRRTIKLFEYLKKYTNRGFLIDPREMEDENHSYQIEADFGNQYSDFEEEMNQRHPTPKMKEVSTTIYVDADHGHDKITGRSITGIISFVGRSPIQWESKHQGAVQTASFGAEFVALRKAVEEAITMRYYLKTM